MDTRIAKEKITQITSFQITHLAESRILSYAIPSSKHNIFVCTSTSILVLHYKQLN
jgi:hypothetical protein